MIGDRMRTHLREPANSLTHLSGGLLSLVALVILVAVGLRAGNPAVLIALTIFGLCQLAMYTASTLFHALRLSETAMTRLLRLDCTLVFVLIAGTYTPVCLIALHGGWRWGLLGAAWDCALGGFFLKLRWLDAPLWLSTGLYVVMGWLILLALPALVRAIPHAGILWMLVGGIVYTVGALVFMLEWPSPHPVHFDAHALWHVFVLAGSFCFFWVMVRYIAPLG